jgi:ABC-type antimicrobial peptide transport system permease subunit
VYFHVGTTRDAGDVLPQVQAALAGRGLFFEQVATHEDALFASVRHRALPAWLFGSLGLGALVVVGAGVLGLLAMTAAQRTRELGIRLALGATRGRIIRMLFAEQLGALALGISAGAVISVWAVRYLESQLYSVRAYDTSVWGLAALLLIAVAAAGTLVPALRASRTDPVQALRAD